MVELVLYMKPNCHLCHEAAALLGRLQGEFPFSVREVDITQNAMLQEEYGDAIPVVEVVGRPLLAAPFGEASARKALKQLIERS